MEQQEQIARFAKALCSTLAGILGALIFLQGKKAVILGTSTMSCQSLKQPFPSI